MGAAADFGRRQRGERVRPAGLDRDLDRADHRADRQAAAILRGRSDDPGAMRRAREAVREIRHQRDQRRAARVRRDAG